MKKKLSTGLYTRKKAVDKAVNKSTKSYELYGVTKREFLEYQRFCELEYT